MNSRRQTGFTLMELMFTVLLAGILLAVGVPSLTQFMRSNGMTSAVNDLVTSALLARAEAVKRHVSVTLCASSNPTAATPTCSATGAQGAFVVFVDDSNGTPGDSTDGNAKVDSGETILKRRAAPGGQIKVWSDAGHYITYGANGFKRKGQGQTKDSVSQILFCDDRGNQDRGGISTARLVNFDWIGRAQIGTTPASITSAASAIAGASCS